MKQLVKQANLNQKPDVKMQVVITSDCILKCIQPQGSENIFFQGVSKSESVFKRIIGEDLIYEMLIKAVNNRTRERNYFRLYSQLSDGVITEDEFNNILSDNEDDYVIEANDIPSEQILKTAIRICKHIKDVDSSEDLSSLFSFNPHITDKYVGEIE